jgi:membrane-associated protease RseP (regulator of RpoE activity)
MAICRACSSEIIGSDRYCRNCGAPVAPVVAEFDDTRRFNPSAPLPSAKLGSPDPTNPLYAPPSAAYADPHAPAPLRRSALLAKLLLRPNLVWAMIFLMLFTFVGLGIGIGARMIGPRRQPGWSERAARGATGRMAPASEDPATARRNYEEAVQNALGFKQGVFSVQDFPDAQGIFVNHLMSDDSPAAVGKIQAGDLITELNNKPVSNNSELSEVLESLKTGDEVPVKVYRDGATISLRIKIANRDFPPLQPKTEAEDQGFLGILDSSRRCCIPGTKKWGVEVEELHLNGPAELFGLRPGDVITEFKGHPVKTPNEFNRHIRSLKPGSKIMVTLFRGNTELKIEVILGRRWEGLDGIMARRARRR